MSKVRRQRRSRAVNAGQSCVVEQHAVYYNETISVLHVTHTDQVTDCCARCSEYTYNVTKAGSGANPCNLWTWCGLACCAGDVAWPRSKLPAVPHLSCINGSAPCEGCTQRMQAVCELRPS